jgi:deoxyribodipyrimidine photo-lyase
VTTAVVVFTRDLRVSDHPGLTAAVAEADHVVPLFVLDDAILSASSCAPNRVAFLLDALRDLDHSLGGLGGRLVLRRGNWLEEVLAVVRDVGAGSVHVSSDVSGYAQRRQRALAAAAASNGFHVTTHPGVTLLEPGAVTPSGGDHYQVFTPYHRRWAAVPRRALARTPPRVRLPPRIRRGRLPKRSEVVAGEPSPDLARGGETEAQLRLDAWAGSVSRYDELRGDLAADATSRLAPYLHFGCVSALQVERRIGRQRGAGAFVRQLCWRDFFAQLLAARPSAAWHDYRPRGFRWHHDPDALTAWRDGRTGYPVVDAAMRQLAHEGFVHNRARMIVASFLTKDLYVDWREGARHFLGLLVDGDLASNNLNWQWVAGTGTDTSPNRVFNPTVQGRRFDPDGTYVRRYVPELRAVRGATVHDPDDASRRACDYPAPIVDHRIAVAAYRARMRAHRAPPAHN